MQEIIIVAGPNGSGKTSFAQRVCRENSYPFLNADAIAQTMPAGGLHNNRIKAGWLFLEDNVPADSASPKFRGRVDPIR